MNDDISAVPLNTGLRIVVIVSTDPSDLYFANQFHRRFQLAGIVLEHQRDPPDRRPRWRKILSLLNRPRDLFNRTCGWFGRAWHKNIDKYLYQELPPDFGADAEHLDRAADCPVLRIEGTGKLNHSDTVEWIRNQSPDLIIICGAALVGKSIIETPTKGVLNLHGGLSQFYRGLFTTDWAVLNHEPEYIGATIHFVTDGVDDGGVVFQGRPVLDVDDHPNRCYEKVVKLGVEMMSSAIIAIAGNELHEAQTPSRLGRLYRHRDFSAAVKRRLWRNWRPVMTEYVKNRNHRDSYVTPHLIHPFEVTDAPEYSGVCRQ